MGNVPTDALPLDVGPYLLITANEPGLRALARDRDVNAFWVLVLIS